MASDLAKALDLQGEIEQLLSLSSIRRYELTIKHFDNNAALASAACPKIRQWLVAKGVSEMEAYKASNYVLANAFARGDGYVRQMIDGAQAAKPQRVRNLSAAIDLDQPIGGPAALADKPHEPARSDSGVPSSEPQQPVALADDLATQRATETFLANALRRYQADTQAALRSAATTIEDTLGKAVDRRWTEALKTFDDKTKDLVRENHEAILAIADKLLPRELIVRSGPIERKLPMEVRHEAFDRILRWLLVGENVYIVGPAGTGKTHMAKQLAQALDKKLYLPGQALSKYDISGYKGPTGEYFGTCVRDALEFGGLLFVDEGDMWAAAALGFLNAPLANGWCTFPDRTIEVHPDFQCIIAANTYGHGATQDYHGRNPLDAASVDRFVFETVDYDENLERLLYGNGPWVQYVWRVRHAIGELKNVRHVISTRAIARVLRGTQTGLTPDQICFSSLWRGLADDTVLKIKQRAGEPPRVLTVVGDDDSLADGTNS